MRHFIGINDDLFIRGDIPMTKQEIRILLLAKAKISPQAVIWDIGAGTGSLSVEAALLAPHGTIYALERETEGVELICANAAKFGVKNLHIIHGSAPAALQGLPDADVIFIGGSGGNLPAILEQSYKQLKPGGKLVIAAITLETLQTSLDFCEAQPNLTVEAFSSQITRIKTRAAYHMLQSLNQIFIIVGSKE